LKLKFLLLLIVPVILVFLNGCSTGGSFIANNVTSVELSEPNFNIIAENTGHSFYNQAVSILEKMNQKNKSEKIFNNLFFLILPF